MAFLHELQKSDVLVLWLAGKNGQNISTQQPYDGLLLVKDGVQLVEDIRVDSKWIEAFLPLGCDSSLILGDDGHMRFRAISKTTSWLGSPETMTGRPRMWCTQMMTMKKPSSEEVVARLSYSNL